MASTALHARGMTNLDGGSKEAAVLGITSKPAFSVPFAWDKGLARLRQEPEFDWLQEGDHQWIHFGGHNHLSTFPQFRKGMFTLRSFSAPGSRMTTIRQDMSNGKTHACLMFCGQKLPTEARETPLFLFWVDLALALRFSDQMEERTNQTDQNRFWIFDWANPKVQLCARRFEL